MTDAWQIKNFAEAGLYDDEQAFLRDAVRALLAEKPEWRLEGTIHRCRTEEISLAKAAALAGVPWERMREILLSRGAPPRLGPETGEEARQETTTRQRIVQEAGP